MSEESLSDRLKCILCRKLTLQNNSMQSNLIDNWDNQCASTLSQILFNCRSGKLTKILIEGGYCILCRQKIRDLHFAYKTVQKLHNQIFDLVQTIVQDIWVNYVNIPFGRHIQKDTSSALLFDPSVSTIFKELESLGLLSKKVAEFNTALLKNVYNISIQEEVGITKVKVQQAQLISKLDHSSEVLKKLKPSLPIRKNELTTIPYNSTINNDCDDENNFFDNEDAEEEDMEEFERECKPMIKEELYDLDSDYENEDNLYDDPGEDENEKSSNQAPSSPKVIRRSLRTSLQSKNKYDIENYMPSSGDEGEKNVAANDDDFQLSDEDCESDQSEGYIPSQSVRRNLRPRREKKTVTEVVVDRPVKCIGRKCGFRFIDKFWMMCHYRKVHKGIPMPYSCPVCEKKFNLSSICKRHIKTIHAEGRPFKGPQPYRARRPQMKNHLKCPYNSCRVRLSNEFWLESHIKKVHQGHPLPYQCGLCQKSFQMALKYKRHVVRFHPGTDKANEISGSYISNKNYQHKLTIKCSYEGGCQRRFKTELSKETHIRMVHLAEPFKCTMCDKEFKLPYVYKRHMNTIHAEIPKERKTPYKLTTVCSHSHDGCNMRFQDEFSMQNHVRKIHLKDPMPYHCPELGCDERFESKFVYARHKTLGHSSIGAADGDQDKPQRKQRKRRTNQSKTITEKFLCSECGKMYYSQQNLDYHIHRHHSEPHSFSPHSCSFCSKPFDTIESMELHISETHQSPNPFKCGDCGEFFGNSFDLRDHFESAHNPKLNTAQCPQCGKFFQTQVHLHRHLKYYHGNDGKIQQCTICKETFENYNSLRTHKKHKHATQSSFKCNECDEVYTHKDSLKMHMRKHTGETPYKCKLCDKSFVRRLYLRRHEEIHSGVKHTCHICGRSTPYKDYLAKHIRRMHPNDPSQAGKEPFVDPRKRKRIGLPKAIQKRPIKSSDHPSFKHPPEDQNYKETYSTSNSNCSENTIAGGLSNSIPPQNTNSAPSNYLNNTFGPPNLPEAEYSQQQLPTVPTSVSFVAQPSPMLNNGINYHCNNSPINLSNNVNPPPIIYPQYPYPTINNTYFVSPSQVLPPPTYFYPFKES